MHTERVTILMTPAKKAALAARAAARHMSIGQYVRRRMEDDEEPEQETELALLVAEVNAAIPKMNGSIDAMIETLRSTRSSIAATIEQLDARR